MNYPKEKQKENTMQYTPNTETLHTNICAITHLLEPRPEDSVCKDVRILHDYFHDENVGCERKATFTYLCKLIENNVRKNDTRGDVAYELAYIFYAANKELDVNATPMIAVSKKRETFEDNYFETVYSIGGLKYICNSKPSKAVSREHDLEMIANMHEELAESIEIGFFRMAVGSSLVDILHSKRSFIYMNEYTTRIMALVDKVLRFRRDAPIMEHVVDKFYQPIHKQKYYAGMAAIPLARLLHAVRKRIECKDEIKRKCIDNWKGMIRRKKKLVKTAASLFKRKVAIIPRIASAKEAITKRDECSLCLDAFDAKKKLISTICGHLFHKECFDEYLKTKEGDGAVSMPCPVCRRYIIVEPDCYTLYPHELSEEQK